MGVLLCSSFLIPQETQGFSGILKECRQKEELRVTTQIVLRHLHFLFVCFDVGFFVLFLFFLNQRLFEFLRADPLPREGCFLKGKQARVDHRASANSILRGRIAMH